MSGNNGEDHPMYKKISIAALAGFLMLAIPSFALGSEWSVKDLNNTVDQVSFIVDDNCSGTLVSVSDRLVLTNYHCAADHITFGEREQTDAEGIIRKVKVRKYVDMTVSQKTFDGFEQTGIATYGAEIVLADKKVDLALLRVKGTIPNKFAAQMIRDSDPVERGERVYIVGNPAMYTASVVEGVVSNVNRTYEFPWTGNEKLPMIQMSGGIYGGNSGGTLFNAAGKMIGVPAAMSSAANFIGLAIPVKEVVKPFLRNNCYVTVGDLFKDGSVNATGGVVKDDACAEAKAKKAKESKKADEHDHGRPE